ncbi:MAG: endonuclease NucS domain-containing protein [Acidobacteriota bacterium]
MMHYWVVICPEPHVRGGLWSRWFEAGCVAVGWPPPEYAFEGPTDSQAWAWTRSRLAEMKPGDKVVPFLLKWRIAPVGTVRALRVTDDEWAPTVGPGEYSANPSEPELGRRIEVDWESDGVPPPGKVAVVPPEKRGKKPLARHTVEDVGEEQFRDLIQILRDERVWVELRGSQEVVAEQLAPRASEEQGLSILERDLQKFLARNLNLVEPGLKPSPEYQLEELITDVGRLDLFCVDKEARYVVVELKAGTAGDDVIGQIGGYMSWVRDSIPNGETVRGIIICREAAPRARIAAKMIPDLKIKRYRMEFGFEDMV